MKNLFKKAHEMTREIAKEYEVDYQAQFGLCLSYLLENKEDKEMLEKEISEKLKSMDIEEKEIENAESILRKFNGINKKIGETLYADRETRRAMKARGLWNDKDFGIEMHERYLGEGKCEAINQKIWSNYGKVRIYFDVLVDGEILSRNHYINIK